MQSLQIIQDVTVPDIIKADEKVLDLIPQSQGIMSLQGDEFDQGIRQMMAALKKFKNAVEEDIEKKSAEAVEAAIKAKLEEDLAKLPPPPVIVEEEEEPEESEEEQDDGKSCAMCLNIMVEPIKLECEHNFCYSCLQMSQKKQSERAQQPCCSVCSTTIDMSNLYEKLDTEL